MTVSILARQMGIDQVPEVFHYVELLQEACDRQVFEDAHKVSPKKQQDKDRREFIAIFKSRYLEFTDYEYDRTITGVDARMMQQLRANLEKNGFTVNEYLAWAFDVFYAENLKFCPPNIKQVCSGHVMQTFQFSNRDRMKEKHRAELQRKEGMALISRGRVLIRKAKKAGMKEKLEMIKKTLSGYGERSIMLGKFRSEIEAYEHESATWQTGKEASSG
jgi:hypothetical protein